MTASPLIRHMPEDGISTGTPSGAYFVAAGDAVQVIVVGVMHFTPGEYIDAYNDLVDDHYELILSSFMTYRPDTAREVLRRGFISLIARR